MRLASGARLGPYEIQSALGAGGMGEVFRARDTRLDRTVAIKVLSPALAADPQFKERFDREARAVSALDHPNICALYDVGREQPAGEAAPVDFLVMQFVSGETLADRLTRGPLKITEVMRLATDVASALDKAHRSGIVHRDLKPGNVMMTASGAGSASSPQAKLLDFGLARIVAPSAAMTMLTAPPTVELTADGTILGTFQYMAPEQLEGGEADPRTDLFAFGALIRAREVAGLARGQRRPRVVGRRARAVLLRQPGRHGGAGPGRGVFFCRDGSSEDALPLPACGSVPARGTPQGRQIPLSRPVRGYAARGRRAQLAC